MILNWIWFACYVSLGRWESCCIWKWHFQQRKDLWPSSHLWTFLSLVIHKCRIIFHNFILSGTPFGKGNWTPRIPRPFSGLESCDKRCYTEQQRLKKIRKDIKFNKDSHFQLKNKLLLTNLYTLLCSLGEDAFVHRVCSACAWSWPGRLGHWFPSYPAHLSQTRLVRSWEKSGGKAGQQTANMWVPDAPWDFCCSIFIFWNMRFISFRPYLMLPFLYPVLLSNVDIAT